MHLVQLREGASVALILFVEQKAKLLGFGKNMSTVVDNIVIEVPQNNSVPMIHELNVIFCKWFKTPNL